MGAGFPQDSCWWNSVRRSTTRTTQAGVTGMPRCVANYPFLAHLATTLNDISSVGSFILGAATFIFLYNIRCRIS